MNDLLNDFPKMEKSGQVAVLYSPGFGAGWSTWNDDEWIPILTTHRDIVQAVMDGDKGTAARIARELIAEATGKPDVYVSIAGVDDLKIEWLDKGSQFEIQGYDGAESIHVIGNRKYQTV